MTETISICFLHESLSVIECYFGNILNIDRGLICLQSFVNFPIDALTKLNSVRRDLLRGDESTRYNTKKKLILTSSRLHQYLLKIGGECPSASDYDYLTPRSILTQRTKEEREREKKKKGRTDQFSFFFASSHLNINEQF